MHKHDCSPYLFIAVLSLATDSPSSSVVASTVFLCLLLSSWRSFFLTMSCRGAVVGWGSKTAPFVLLVSCGIPGIGAELGGKHCHPKASWSLQTWKKWPEHVVISQLSVGVQLCQATWWNFHCLSRRMVSHFLQHYQCVISRAGTLPAVSSSCTAASVIPGVPSAVLQMVALSPDCPCVCLGPYCSLLPVPQSVRWNFGLTHNGWSYLSAACAVFLPLWPTEEEMAR